MPPWGRLDGGCRQVRRTARRRRRVRRPRLRPVRRDAPAWLLRATMDGRSSCRPAFYLGPQHADVTTKLRGGGVVPARQDRLRAPSASYDDGGTWGGRTGEEHRLEGHRERGPQPRDRLSTAGFVVPDREAPHGAWPLVAANFGTRGYRGPTPRTV